MTTGRALAIWLGSFISIAAISIVYFKTPLVPLLAAGAATLVITVIRSTRSKR